MSLDNLKEKRRIAWLELIRLADIYHGIEPLFKEIETQFNNAQTEYRLADYNLALVDGRMEKVQAATSNSKPKVKKMPDLTEEQIMELAAELGIKLEDV